VSARVRARTPLRRDDLIILARCRRILGRENGRACGGTSARRRRERALDGAHLAGWRHADAMLELTMERIVMKSWLQAVLALALVAHALLVSLR
jgi:hypothetical protein